jgi:hypothetical protein
MKTSFLHLMNLEAWEQVVVREISDLYGCQIGLVGGTHDGRGSDTHGGAGGVDQGGGREAVKEF